jgi:isopenicillin N synthase-like dioxygenase
MATWIDDCISLIITWDNSELSMSLIASNLRETLRVDGFFLLKISEDIQEKLRATFDAGYSFFHTTLEEKLLYRFPEEMGYRPFGIEYSQTPTYPDQVESFTVSRRVPTPISELHSRTVRVLCERMLATFDEIELIAETVTIELATAISHRPVIEQMRGTFRRWSRLQLNYSRPSKVALPFINEPHEDGDFITISCSNAPGLEVQMTNNEFTPITTVPGEVLLLPGEIAWLLSGGQIRPAFHRVRPHHHYSERMALLFFGDIDPHHCQPWVENELNQHVDIGARILTSVNRFGLKGFSTE